MLISRALIDKVLARYSGDWTTLRELIQNAADASAKVRTALNILKGINAKSY
jgi:HSP90 family molecular chaperone